MALVGRRSTIRLPCTLCSRTIRAVEKAFSAIFCAVPAFSRVLPDTSSGPVSRVRPISACAASGEPGLLARPMVSAPASRAARNAPSAHGVVPEAASNNATSQGPGVSVVMSAAPRASSSSAPSTERSNAPGPPAISAWARSCGQLNVGCSSTLSSRPSRPEVPAPAYSSRPPARMRGKAASTAWARPSRTLLTASTACCWLATSAASSCGVSYRSRSGCSAAGDSVPGGVGFTWPEFRPSPRC